MLHFITLIAGISDAFGRLSWPIAANICCLLWYRHMPLKCHFNIFGWWFMVRICIGLTINIYLINNSFCHCCCINMEAVITIYTIHYTYIINILFEIITTTKFFLEYRFIYRKGFFYQKFVRNKYIYYSQKLSVVLKEKYSCRDYFK